MSIFKRGRIYWYKFMWNGEMVRRINPSAQPKYGSTNGSGSSGISGKRYCRHSR